jgi:CRP/FNR family cyclic AMP-dependent transcriptional regulator
VESTKTAQAPLFEALDEETTRHLRASMTEVRLRRGEVLFQEGEAGDRVYVIADGKIKLGHTAPDGRETLIAVLGPSEMLGELALFDPGPRAATATAIAPTRLLELRHDDLTGLLAGRPELSAQLLQSLARRLRKTNAALADLVFSDVPGRVAKALLDLAKRFGEPVDEGIRLVHDLTQEELAQLVGASRETVNKALAEFGNRGWIRLEGKAVVILDEARLVRRAK